MAAGQPGGGVPELGAGSLTRERLPVTPDPAD